jgi:CRP-like cAMP-binding protein
MVSTVMPLADGEMIEVGLIGPEGFAGAPALLGSGSAPTEALAQTPASALRLRAGLLREEMQKSQALLGLLLRYVCALHTQACQSAACNAHHVLTERLARWLLMAHDRWANDELPLSHEFIAMMLGVRRPGVTIAVGTLKHAGLIGTEHGRITILDRPNLEAAACECYRAVRDQYERVLL